MKSRQSITLELPVDGTGQDYAGAVALAMADANCCGDLSGAKALAGLMSAIKLPASHDPQIELGPWIAGI